MSEKYTRIHRLLRILTLIQSQKGWNAIRLADECGTSERNIYRDLNMLQGAGIPCYYCDDTQGYRVRGDFFLPPVELTLEESLSLLALAEVVGQRNEQLPMLRHAGRAIEKIRGRLPAKVLREVEPLDGAIQIKLAASQAGDSAADVYELVRQAIADRRALRCQYEAVTSEPGQSAGEVFMFRPYRLLFNQRAWYAIGHHSSRDAVRCLKLNRFVRCEPTEQPYVVPQDFDMDDFVGLAWRLIRGQQRYQVVLRFDPSFAETIADTHWHHTQKIDWHDDGSITFRCQVDGLDEIVWWVLSMGPHCRVIEPAALAQRVRQAARQMLQQYEQGDVSQPARSR